MKKRSLEQLGRDAEWAKRQLGATSSDLNGAADCLKDIKDLIDNLEGELQDAWSEVERRDEHVDSLEHDIMKLKELLESHWCCCGKCHVDEK